MNAYGRSHYQRNKKYYFQKNKEDGAKRRVAYRKLKESLSCSKCGFKHPAAIDFHHVDPSTKSGSIAHMISDNRIPKAMAEIAKCIPLCANCHRILHYEERRIGTP
jgi:predicted HNH restriction endonuclease